MDVGAICQLSAAQAADHLREGELSAEEYARGCVERIAEHEERVQAWAFFDPAHALEQARQLDDMRAMGRPIGPLHGVPVGVKDIIDVRGMPTGDGTPLHAGRIATEDATLVSRLREAGAVIMGKTVTTELATYAPGKTRNPHNSEHTPGGSSSGSAAAVAIGMVPLAVGTQTNGSVLRPAAYCGVVGFKPSYGLISRHGVLTQSPPLDQVGVFARTVEDAALLAQTLAGFDEADAATRPMPRPPFTRIAAEAPPLPPTLAFVPTPMWDDAAADTREAFAELVEFLGERVRRFDLPEKSREALEWHRLIMEADLAGSFEREYETGRDQLSGSLRAQIERGRQVLAVDYRRALARVPILNNGFEPLFDEFDAILTPATAGTAPAGLESTGSPMFCTLWTLCGMPCISLPLLTGENGLPLGLQLVGRRGDDGRLLRTARWLSATLAQASP
ncbi:MAG: amidase [Sterolibacteriaceae bacterium]|uniref:Amidase n=1 Tax=Candidatus Methylophosphatis roskildensis TaxID=2899263 RepID=A0A9D7HRP6_9PROT|nr:amidase [Candidatus Methylophosphatis roskildensis]MBK7236072.1 amidase [Sterolibacteriaceae bacterium]